MAWRRTGYKPLSEPMLTQITDAYMRHQGEMSQSHESPYHIARSGEVRWLHRFEIWRAVPQQCNEDGNQILK